MAIEKTLVGAHLTVGLARPSRHKNVDVGGLLEVLMLDVLVVVAIRELRQVPGGAIQVTAEDRYEARPQLQACQELRAQPTASTPTLKVLRTMLRGTRQSSSEPSIASTACARTLLLLQRDPLRASFLTGLRAAAGSSSSR